MIRIIAILIALLAGLASLFVSVCGGGFFVSLGFQSVRTMFRPDGLKMAVAGLPVLMLAAGCAAIGGWVFWQCVKFIRREWRDGR